MISWFWLVDMKFPTASGAANWIRWNCRCTIGSKRLDLMNHGESWWSFTYMDIHGSSGIICDHAATPRLHITGCCNANGGENRLQPSLQPQSCRCHARVLKSVWEFVFEMTIRFKKHKTSLGEVQTKDHKRPSFFLNVWCSWIFYDFDPERLCSSEAAHLLVPGGQRSSSDVESPLRPWHLLLTAGWLLKYVLLWSYDHHFRLIYGFSRNHPGEVAYF